MRTKMTAEPTAYEYNQSLGTVEPKVMWMSWSRKYPGKLPDKTLINVETKANMKAISIAGRSFIVTTS